MEENKDEIRVPALIESGRVLVPEFSLGRELKYKFDKRGNPLPAMVYTMGAITPEEISDWISGTEYKVPTLSELTSAYFGKNPDGSWLSSEYRESIKKGAKVAWANNELSAEWTSSYLMGNKLIDNPENFELDKERNIWIPVGGKETRVFLPDRGWVVEYDKESGMPIKTSNNSEAKDVFGEDASYFNFNPSGVRSIVVTHGIDGPFGIVAVRFPNEGHELIGARNCRRL